MGEANDFVKLASAMALADKESSSDKDNLNAAQMSDALKALADVAVNDHETFMAGWITALKAAQLRKFELDNS